MKIIIYQIYFWTNIIAMIFVNISCNDIPKTETLEKQNIKIYDQYFTIGAISKSVRNEATIFSPLAEYIAANIDSTGNTGGRVMVATELSELIDSVNNNSIDMFIDSPSPILKVNEKTNTEIILLHAKKYEMEYSSVIYTLRSNEINTLDDLKGKVISFDSPFSTTGYLLPYTLLLEKGYRVQEIKNPLEKVNENTIGYIFSYKDDNTFLWVLKGKTDAGVTDNYYLEKKGGENNNKLKIIAESEKFPRQLVLINSLLKPSTKEKLKNILLNIHKVKSGRETINTNIDKQIFYELSKDHLNRLEKVKKLIRIEK